jgi:hypothetical protein
VTSAPQGATVTFTLAAGGDDGDVALRTSSYPPTGTADAADSGNVFTAGRRLVGNNFQVFDALVRFDTSALPDGATVTGATLKLWVNKKSDADNRNLVGEWYPPSQWPINSADWTLNPGSTALGGADVTAIATNATSSFALQNLASVSRTGYTGLRLGIDGGQPSGDNLVQFATIEGGKPAQLVVTYTNGPPTPPANTAPPTISGAAQETQTLTADPGTWTGTAPINFTYQWLRCDGSGANCSNIANATQSTYLVATADIGSTLRVSVSASNTAGSAGPVASAPTAVVTAAPNGGTLTFTVAAGGDDGNVDKTAATYPPGGSADPYTIGTVFTAGRRAVFGNFQVFDALVRFDTSALPDNATVTGATLKIWVNGKADGDNRNLVGEWYDAAQWPIDGADWTLNPGTTALAGADVTAIGTGATSSFALQNLGSVSKTGFTGLRMGIDGGQPTGDNYVQFASLEGGKPAQLVVTYTNGPPTPPANTAPPTISGTAQQAQTLNADPGTWTGSAPINFTYQWNRCDSSGANCSPIGGATQQTYLVASGDVGSTLRVAVSASNAAGSAGPVVSAATAVVTSAPSGGTVTFTLAAGGDDGDVTVRAGTYPPSAAADSNSSGTVFTAARRFVLSSYQVFDGLLRFDTSSLPDNATVTAATLKLWVNAKTDADNRNLVGEWYPAAQWPIDGADWALNPGNTALAGADVTAIATGATSSFALQNLSSISTTGLTGLRLGIDGGQPAGDNYVQFATLESGKPAQLVVTYTTP